jgi:phage recombination protein Bet
MHSVNIKKPKQTMTELLADTDSNIYHTLKNSIYPGAKDESIGMVVAYCKAKKYDPIAKPVHIVPMSVKNSQTNSYEYRDVIMPGIASYRIDADRTGLYLGISEPEYGPTQTVKLGDIDITYPEWCKMTVEKYNPTSGKSSFFSAKEYWIENYATKGKIKGTQTPDVTPNAMWTKRPFGQIAKCTEAQALRKAFPDVFGSVPTFEEMEGKETKDIVEHVDVNERVSYEQLDLILDRLKAAGSESAAVCSYLNIESLECMLAKDFDGVIRQLNKKIAVKQKIESLPINQVFDEPNLSLQAAQ